MHTSYAESRLPLILETTVCRPSVVISFLVLAGLSGALPLLAAERPQSALPPPAHASGGIGDDDPLMLIAGDYNLQLVFATQGSGEYLADVKVLIADASGRTQLETLSPGPQFYVRLAAGNYRITVTYGGQVLHRQVAITDRRRQSLHFYWPAEEANAAK